ncbi:Toll-like receptor 2 type-1 [Dissostichus eleginoides]|uniref:Toll-like receptor 2 type-1 n=1 Tax=Dissostichus eleginoides TaxID=100907 RepID=A0AAD9BQ02_DISEL|nr:Toll-like receptor 2 type-1 [Dissostichus eleginoides]
MTWAWLRAKRKPKLKKGELEYDAFVSYSEMDSGWVEAHLVPELEQVEPRLRLCLHKRDFVPGGWILDNIGRYREELFDHNDDTVVLILLEPIDKETVPKKFCKLRRVMNSRTYLEWPEDHDQIPGFWHSLRTAIKKPETDLISRDVQRYFGRCSGDQEACDIYSDSVSVKTSGRLRYYDDLLKIARAGSPEEPENSLKTCAEDRGDGVAKGSGLGPLAELFKHKGPSQVRCRPMVQRHLPLSFWTEPSPCCSMVNEGLIRP